MLRHWQLLSLASAFCAASLGAQAPTDSAKRVLFVDSEWERYLRVLQDAGATPLHPWSVRPFGPREAEQLRPAATEHPWERADAFTARALEGRGRVTVDVLPIATEAIYNSRFPYGFNDGPVWAGRGLTTVVQGGVVAAGGPVTLVLAPVAFRAENSPFPLRPNGKTGSFAFGDAFNADYIDQPQRFGGAAYQRIAPGNSTLRIDQWGAAIGVSTADQWWGPAATHPLILGNNAGGFPHVFIGTGTPLSLGPIAIHGKFVWGRLEQTEYFAADKRSRLAMGTAMVVTSRFVPGLEIGGTRFFHLLWTDDVLRSANLMKPITGLFKTGRIGASGNPFGTEPDNQLASVFARWVFPGSGGGGGFEVYGEYAREDNSWDLRDFELEPDHSAGYTLGFARTWARRHDVRLVLRGEVINTRLAPLRVFRAQAPFYYHTTATQGHTYMGQVLGSVAGNGGGGSVLALDRYTPGGRWTFAWNRIGRAQYAPGALIDDFRADIMHAFTVENLRLRGRIGALYELTGVTEFNRNFGPDVFSLRASAGLVHAW